MGGLPTSCYAQIVHCQYSILNPFPRRAPCGGESATPVAGPRPLTTDHRQQTTDPNSHRDIRLAPRAQTLHPSGFEAVREGLDPSTRAINRASEPVLHARRGLNFARALSRRAAGDI